MRRRVAISRDTLQAHRLPPTENMELNYRPALVPASWVAAQVGLELGVVGLLIFLALLTLSWIAPILAFSVLFAWTLPILFFSISPVAIAQIEFKTPGTLEAWAFWLAAVVVITLLAQFESLASIYFLVFGTAVVFATLLAILMAKQAAYWMTVHPRVDWREVRLWKQTWSQLFRRRIPERCPEILTLRLALVVLAIQLALGYECFRASAQSARHSVWAGWPVAAFIFLPLPMYWLLWNVSGVVPRLPVRATFRAVRLALQIWLAYLPDATPRPGVFLLPTRWLRRGMIRQALFFAAIGGLAVGVFMITHAHFTGHDLPANAAGTWTLALDQATDWTIEGFLQALALSILIPPLVFLLLVWFVVGSLLARYWLALEAPDAYHQSSDKSAWAIAINRLLNSRDAREQEHLLLGRALFGDYPVLLHRKLLQQHGHLLGDSGARKTSLGIAPLIAQLIAAGDASIVLVDLKGDRALFETARLEAAAAGADFRWFTPEPGDSSHVFNPLEQSHLARFTPSQKTQLILEALALNYGDAYGRGYFSAVNEAVLLNFLRNYHVRNFRELYQLVMDPRMFQTLNLPDDPHDVRHLSTLLDRLTSIPNLNITRDELADRPHVAAAAIDMATLLARPQVVYFHLRSPLAPITTPAIAKLVMYSLFSAAANRQAGETLPVYIVIDEFQQIVSENVPLVFEQARSSRLTFLIAHQNLDQLDRKAVRIRSAVSSCTAFKQFFRASDPDTIRYLEEQAGEGRFESLTWQQAIDPALGVDHDESFSPMAANDGLVEATETIGPRLERNTIIDVSATPNTSFVLVTEGSGYTQFSGYVTPIISDYHISEEAYDARNAAEWPPADDTTVVVERPPPPAPKGTAPNLDAIAQAQQLRDATTGRGRSFPTNLFPNDER